MAITNLLSGTYAISNTGPLISAFQSDSFVLLTKICKRLEICRARGTHYARVFIQQVYEMAKSGQR